MKSMAQFHVTSFQIVSCQVFKEDKWVENQKKNQYSQQAVMLDVFREFL